MTNTATTTATEAQTPGPSPGRTTTRRRPKGPTGGGCLGLFITAGLRQRRLLSGARAADCVAV